MLTSLHGSLGTTFIAYVSDNLTCLFYGAESLATKYAFFASYHDLLADIAEAFGVWTALVVLALSSLVVLASIQQVTALSWESKKTESTLPASTTSLTTYSYFTRRLQG